MSYLQRHPKTGVYYFRRAVPGDLRKAIGLTEIKVTLGAKDVRRAKALVMAKAQEVDAQIRGRSRATGCTIGKRG
jgi:hypothetical protein